MKMLASAASRNAYADVTVIDDIEVKQPAPDPKELAAYMMKCIIDAVWIPAVLWLPFIIIGA